MSYPHLPPPPYRSDTTFEISTIKITHHLHDPFGTAFKVTMGIVAALFIGGLLTTMAWIAVFSALVVGTQP